MEVINCIIDKSIPFRRFQLLVAETVLDFLRKKSSLGWRFGIVEDIPNGPNLLNPPYSHLKQQN